MLSEPPQQDSVGEFFAREGHAMVELLRELVLLEAPTENVAAVTAFVKNYAQLLEEAGLDCHVIPGPNGPHLFAERIPSTETQPPLVLVGHSDTVWPLGEVAERPPRLRDGCLYGPGVYDMRGGLCLAVFVMRFLQAASLDLPFRVQVFLAADEEVGSVTAHEHMERLLPPTTTAFVLEPPTADGSLKAERKGVALYTLKSSGREAHAGAEPEAGVNAIDELMAQLTEINSWADPELGLQVNVGQIGGGTATNVVPRAASGGIDVRFVRLQDGERFDQRIRGLRPRNDRAGLELEGGIIFPPLVEEGRNRELCELAIEVGGRMGLRLGRGKTGGGSDASFLSACGLGVLDGLGVDGGGAHAQDEHVVVERLPVRGELLTRLVLALAEDRG